MCAGLHASERLYRLRCGACTQATPSLTVCVSIFKLAAPWKCAAERVQVAGALQQRNKTVAFRCSTPTQSQVIVGLTYASDRHALKSSNVATGFWLNLDRFCCNARGGHKF